MTTTPTSGAADLRTAALAAGQATAALAAVQDDVVTLVRAAQAPVLEPDSHKKRLELEAMACGPLAAATQPAPVLWVSPEQFANFMDADEAPFGKYIPARKTSAGNFTMPLFAVRATAPEQPAAQQPHGAAYAATPECLTCSDHGAVGNILTAEPCPDCTRLNDQPAPATQQAGESVYAFRRKGLEDFCTCDEARYEELSNKPHLFETRVFYTAPTGANENAKLVTLIAKCRDAFPIPAHGDPIENYWSAAIEDPSNVPAYLQEIAKRKQADSVQEDAARLDYLHSTGSTIEMLPGEVGFYQMRFRVGGLHSAVSPNLREAIDIARKEGGAT